MSNRRCAAKTCFNLQGCRPNLKFFPFPKDETICRQWVANCGRPDLHGKPLEQLTKLLLCADHFESHWFLNPKYKTVFIRTGNPIPTIFHNNLADFVPKSLRKNVELKNVHSQESGEADQPAVTLEVAMDEDSSQLGAAMRCHKMCRLCACLVYEDKLMSIFSQESVEQCLLSKINMLLPEKVEEQDGLPHHVCNVCIGKLNDCSLTVEAFIAADKKLRDLFENSYIASQEPTYIKLEEECLHYSCRSGKPDGERDMAEGTSLQGCQPTYIENTSGDGDDHRDCHDGKPDELPEVDSNLSEFLTVKNDSLSSEISFNGVVPDKTIEVYSLGQDVVVEEEEHHAVKEDSCESFEGGPAGCFPGEFVTTEIWTEECNASPERAGPDSDNVINGTDKLYSCVICNKTFEGKNKLLIHEITQHACDRKTTDGTIFPRKYKRRQTHTCKECGNSFVGLKPLKRHTREYHIPAENICEYCGAHYKIKSQLEVHRRLHTNEKPFSCGICDESFHFKKALRRHKRIHIEPKSLTCKICNKTFGSRSAMWRHERIHTSNRNVLCYLCGKVLSNSQSLRVHMRTHSSDRPCSCPTCGKTFKDNRSVTKHMAMHSAAKNFRCDVCGRAFYSKALVKQHKLSHSGVKPHKCETCGAAFNRLGNLNQHKKKHVLDGADTRDRLKPTHECVVCGKWMKSELTLKYHLAKHTGEKKPFDCELCGKRFVAVDPYRVHMRIHTGERPYECNMCDKTFRSSFTLKQHAALHRDEFPYPCTYCERRFKRLQSLVVHKRTHTGEKPHQCPSCGRCFAQKGDMIKHTKTHDRGKAMVLDMAHIADLVLSDTDMTSEFLIDMPIVEVETEMQPDIHSGMKPDIHLEIQPDIHSEIHSDIHSQIQQDVHSDIQTDIHSEIQPGIHCIIETEI